MTEEGVEMLVALGVAVVTPVAMGVSGVAEGSCQPTCA